MSPAIAAIITINGDINSSSDFRLDGHLIGNFRSEGKIVIGPSGSLKGNIICTNADIEGKFEGKIQVDETLNVKQNAQINGEVICGKLSEIREKNKGREEVGG